jgi:hypothetical protein
MKLISIFEMIIVLIAGIGMVAGQASPYTQHKEFTGIFHGNGFDHDCSIEYDVDYYDRVTNGHFYIGALTDEQSIAIPGLEGYFEGDMFNERIPFTGHLIIHNPAGGPDDGADENGVIQFGGGGSEQPGKAYVYVATANTQYSLYSFMMLFNGDLVNDFAYTGPKPDLPYTGASSFESSNGLPDGGYESDDAGLNYRDGADQMT